MNQTATKPAAVSQATSIGDLQEYSDPRSTSALMLDSGAMEQMMRVATFMASAKATVPQAYRGSPGDCLAVVMQAHQWRMSPFAVAQKTHFVSGTIGYEAQLVNAVITSMAPTKDRLHFEWFGDWSKIVGKFREVESKTKKDDNGHPQKYRVPDWKLEDEVGLGVKVWATMKGEDEPRVLEILMTQARTRNSTLWADDPKQQIAYLATKRWSRLYCPDVIMGVYTPDELDEIRPEKDITAEGETLGADKPNAKDALKQSATGIKPPTLGEVKAAIDKATTPEETNAARDLAGKLVSPADKVSASEHYKARVATLRAAAAESATTKQTDATTDPIKQENAGAPAETVESVGKSMQLAYDNKNRDALDAAASLIPTVGNITQQKVLNEQYKQHIADLNE